MGIITEIIDAIKLVSKSTIKYSAINDTLRQSLAKNINLIKRIDYSNLTNDDVKTLALALHTSEIEEYIGLHIKEQRWVCNLKVTTSIIGQLKASRLEGCYLDEILKRSDIKYNDLITASDLAPIKSPKTRFENLKTDYILSVKLLNRVK